MGRTVTGLHFNEFNRTWVVTHVGADGRRRQELADHVISSAPLRHLVCGLSPAVSDAAREAAEKLRYRDFLTVALVVRDRGHFTDNWVYIHDPGVKVGRVQNFKSWSPEMVPDPSLNCYGLEYFCFEGDGLWNASDADLIALAKREIAQVGLADPADVLDGTVVRQPKAYPVYDDDYARHVETIRTELDEHYPNLHLVGRNGMHKYNNQDHAMMTALLCAENILAGRPVYDLWAVNSDAEYHEAGGRGDTGLRLVPTRVKEEAVAAAS
jgi:protoporphyrinogen oxidase